MPERNEDLHRFLTVLGDALAGTAAADPGASALIERIFAALETPAPEGQDQPGTLPVCEFLPAALVQARRLEGAAGALAAALADLAPRLQWRHRPGGGKDDGAFRRAHGSARVAGPDGLECRTDVTVGVSLLAPATRYPNHHHPPEEVYFVLSPGQWRQTDGPWHSPGPGGLVHNPPGIVHAMRADADAPLLAVWCLWHG